MQKVKSSVECGVWSVPLSLWVEGGAEREGLDETGAQRLQIGRIALQRTLQLRELLASLQ